MIHRHEIEAVTDALWSAKRCPEYEWPKSCGGLEGCEECITRAAKAVLKAMEGM